MRIWDEIRADLEKARQDFADDLAKVRAEVAELRAKVEPAAPEAPEQDGVPPTAEPAP